MSVSHSRTGPSFDYRKVAFFRSIHTECASPNQCALNVLMQLLRVRKIYQMNSILVTGHSVSYIFDNSQMGLAVSSDEDGEKLVYSHNDLW